MKDREKTIFAAHILLSVFFWYFFIDATWAKDIPRAPESYRKFFVHYVDRRSYVEKILNSFGMTRQDIGRSFALIAGVSYYPKMSQSYRHLKPAAADIRKLQDYLQQIEFFDEIVVIHNEDMTYDNLVFFLQSYFPERLQQFPKSRFLFAYSGHGITKGSSGYLLLSPARSFSDTLHSMDLKIVRDLFDEVLDSGHHILALINSCYSGAFIKTSFGGSPSYLPRHKGAHVITSGGTRELAWYNPDIGNGSVFFERLFEGLDGQADIYPKETSGDGMITAYELATYLRQTVQISTKQKQNPQFDNILRQDSRGGFFFLNHRTQVKQGTIKPLKAETAKNFGDRMSLSTKAAIGLGTAAAVGGGIAFFVDNSDGSEENNKDISFTGAYTWEQICQPVTSPVPRYCKTVLELTQNGNEITGTLGKIHTLPDCCTTSQTVAVAGEILSEADIWAEAAVEGEFLATLTIPPIEANCEGDNGCSMDMKYDGYTTLYELIDNGRFLVSGDYIFTRQ